MPLSVAQCSRLYVQTELGVERRCARCGDLWPAKDPEFWRLKRPGVWQSWCRACLAEYDQARRRGRQERSTGSARA